MLNTIVRAINALFKLYLSASAKGVIASGIADSMIELVKFDGFKPKNFIPK